MKSITYIAVLIILTFLDGCRDTGPIKGNLDRSGAARLIRESKSFKEPGNFKFSLEQYSRCENLKKDNIVFDLVEMGLAKMQTAEVPLGRGIGYTGSLGRCRIELTEEGKKQSTQWTEGQVDFEKGWIIPVASKDLIEVTGISGADKEDAMAEYTWKWAHNNFAQKLKYTKLDKEIKKGQALFKKYDDGWRIVD